MIKMTYGKANMQIKPKVIISWTDKIPYTLRIKAEIRQNQLELIKIKNINNELHLIAPRLLTQSDFFRTKRRSKPFTTVLVIDTILPRLSWTIWIHIWQKLNRIDSKLNVCNKLIKCFAWITSTCWQTQMEVLMYSMTLSWWSLLLFH